MAKKLKYFLDHPQIKRKPSPGNGAVPIKGEQPAENSLSHKSEGMRNLVDRVVSKFSGSSEENKEPKKD